MAVKASRYLTHLKRLRDPEEPIVRLFERAASLGDRLGPVLYQLPPAFSLNLDRRARVALCLHDKHGSAIADPVVGPVLYVRFHGTTGRYHGSYDKATLARWAGRLREHQQDGMRVFAYFNNDPEGVAVKNALSLRQLLADSASPDRSSVDA